MCECLISIRICVNIDFDIYILKSEVFELVQVFIIECSTLLTVATGCKVSFHTVKKVLTLKNTAIKCYQALPSRHSSVINKACTVLFFTRLTYLPSSVWRPDGLCLSFSKIFPRILGGLGIFLVWIDKNPGFCYIDGGHEALLDVAETQRLKKVVFSTIFFKKTCSQDKFVVIIDPTPSDTAKVKDQKQLQGVSLVTC